MEIIFVIMIFKIPKYSDFEDVLFGEFNNK